MLISQEIPNDVISQHVDIAPVVEEPVLHRGIGHSMKLLLRLRKGVILLLLNKLHLMLIEDDSSLDSILKSFIKCGIEVGLKLHKTLIYKSLSLGLIRATCGDLCPAQTLLYA